MTINEAIKEIKDASDSEVRYGDKEHHYNEVMKRVEAFDMAIKALEQEPCEDAISRTAAIVQLSHNKNGDDDCDVIIQKDIETIKALPSVTPKILEPCEDCVSREALIQSLQMHRNFFASSYGSYQYMAPKDKVRVDEIDNCIARVVNAPSVTPKFTDDEIQKMQELEQAQLEKAYELGRAEVQPCDDCVSRDAVHEMIENVPISNNDKWFNWQQKVCLRLAELPSVTPSRPKGKWIQIKDDCDGVNFYDFSFKCSKCGKEQSFKSNYCPNCGADMRGDKMTNEDIPMEYFESGGC